MDVREFDQGFTDELLLRLKEAESPRYDDMLELLRAVRPDRRDLLAVQEAAVKLLVFDVLDMISHRKLQVQIMAFQAGGLDYVEALEAVKSMRQKAAVDPKRQT